MVPYSALGKVHTKLLSLGLPALEVAFYMFGRLASGVSFDRAQAEFAAVARRATYTGTESGRILRPMSFRTHAGSSTRR